MWGSQCAGWRGRGLRNTPLSPFQLSEWISIVLPSGSGGPADLVQFNFWLISIDHIPKGNILKENIINGIFLISLSGLKKYFSGMKVLVPVFEENGLDNAHL